MIQLKKIIKDKNDRRSLLIGVISSVLGTIIISILQYIYKNARETGKGLFLTIINMPYKIASVASPGMLILILLWVILVILLGIGLIFLARSIRVAIKIHVLKSRLKKVKDKKSDLHGKDDNQDSGSAKNDDNTVDKMESEVDKLESDIDDISKASNSIMRNCILLAIATLMSFLLCYYWIIIPFASREQFELDISLIKPYTTEENVGKLQSEWVRMKTKSDYDKIYEIINEIKEREGLQQK